MSKKIWDKIFNKKKWGKYPDLSVVREIKNFFPFENNKKKKCLEIGFGAGGNLYFFLNEKFNTYGIEHSKNAFKQAKKNLKKFKIEKKLKLADIKSIPFKNNFFDIVVDCECLYANKNKDFITSLSEIKRVLKPKGIFFSKTFAVGSFKDGYNTKIKNEKKTFKNSIGLVKRYMSNKDINKTYGNYFKIIKTEIETRTTINQSQKIKEWSILMLNEK